MGGSAPFGQTRGEPSAISTQRWESASAEGVTLMRRYFLGLTAMAALAGTSSAAWAGDDSREGVPNLDHVFVIVLENHNSFTSFGSIGILDNPNAPHIQALAKKYNFASNYNAVWHPSLPNYVAMITGDWIGTDVVATGHTYAPNSTVGIS